MAYNKQYYILAAILSFAFLLSACGVHGKFAKAEKKIPGYYKYSHSWDYPSPKGGGDMHCDETGVLIFYDDGTYYDTAYQTHYWTPADSATRVPFDYHYCCKGRWRVENDKFLFNEMAEGFVMDAVNEFPLEWYSDFSKKLVGRSTPRSDRWFSFDIERLDNEWFIWSYTYPNGRKDTWEMHRVKPNKAKFGRL
ncbi:MAG: hypothetical protein J6X86_02060 [Bacteroidales bacterium]|nr:hypothetical protein [Bacteroidales bacterium]